MKHIKKIMATLLTVCLLASAAGCIVQVNQEKNRNIVVAKIDGKYDVLKGDYLDLFTYYIAFYNSYGISITNKQLEEIRSTCMDTVIEQKILEIEMEKVNFEINDDDRKKAEEKLEEDIKELAEKYKKEAEWVKIRGKKIAI